MRSHCWFYTEIPTDPWYLASSIPWARVRRAPWSLLAGAFATVLHDHRIGARRLRAWIDQEPHTEVDHTGVIPMITIEQLLFPMYQGLRPNDLGES